jgi:hypothetical protein
MASDELGMTRVDLFLTFHILANFFDKLREFLSSAIFFAISFC